ncbi:O-antigen ligase family protein [Reichenbachiella sp. MALMAid0571]|uniref:O-antigen ligase family protein n=1 Tax=Reichenbachiella sp. MALMAid0571 TaxID=3143939 RepID=UPI0032DEA75F
MGKNKKNKIKKEKKVTAQELPVRTSKPQFWNNKLNWIIVLMFVLPFVYSGKSMEPSLSPRFIFESSFLLVYHLYFFGIRRERYFINFQKIASYAFLLASAFVLWSVVTTLSSINFEESVYEVSRNVLNLLLLFTVVHAVVNSKMNFMVFCRMVAIAVIIHGFIGLDENFEWGNTKFPGGVSPHGLMANRNLFGSAMALMFPFVIYLVYKGKGFWRGIGTFSMICLIASIVVAQTRAAWISAMLVFMIAVVGVLIFLPDLRKRTISVFVIGCSGLAVIFGLIKYHELLNERPQKRNRKVELSENNKKAEVKEESNTTKKENQEEVSILKKINTNSESINERLVVWQESIGIIKDHPVLGVGPGNWKVTVPYYRIGGIRNDYGKIVRIRPHNIYVQVLTENGIIGFLLYYGSWVLVLTCALIVLFKSEKPNQKLMMIMLTAGFASFALDGMFSFPLERYEHTLFLFVMMGLAIGSYLNHFKNQKEEEPGYAKWTRLLLIPIAGFLAWNIFLGMERHRFEYHMNRAKAYQKRKDNNKIIKEVMAGKSKYVSLDPNKDPLEIQSAMAYKNLKVYDKAMVEAKQALLYNPHSTRNLNTLGTIYTETKKYDSAIITYKKALYYAPYYEVTLKNLALNYLYSKDYKSCLETLEQFDIEGDEYFQKVLKAATYHYNKQQAESKNEEAGE